ncbi:prospero homeobox protein 1-like [Dunckerocampus dactyliophorus]|uniref:prospero homeobox protein 1-like n=1 Tax=Dunckerocampus dactyliophorus TaxID=161453 RepID=UPI002406BBF5|nr:prospero homeobox protein 1-like [Dunckerocampus dactyliophorus]
MHLSMWNKNLCSRMDHCTGKQPFESDSQVPDKFEPSGKVSEKNRKLLENFYYGSSDLVLGEHPCSPAAKPERSGRQAKRARVENIIRGMTPGDGLADAQMKEEHEAFGMQVSQSRMGQGGGDIQSSRYQGWKTAKMGNFSSKLMADVLKYELSRAVSRSVDSVFKSMPLPLKDSDCADSQRNPSTESSGGDDEELPVQDVQTEALSLVVQGSQTATVHQPRNDPTAVVLNAVHRSALGCRSGWESRQVTFDSPWNSIKVGSKVNSRSLRSPPGHMIKLDAMLLDNLCLPHVKIEPSSPLKKNAYVLSEGLTTTHLKKAKLMFFYTRYPSSMVLKMCFRDVQMTRCITSQLIKWFSNFREFYYIQMEKFARHIVLEGASDARALSVGRESELFRALNMHYNKGNDFQVPDRFLEVAEITLRQFYIAIFTGKDREPSWKKTIYKVICKLDTDVPAEFKSYG